MDVFLVQRANGWHVEERRGGRVTDYGPFRVKRRALDMRNAIIESDLQRNAPMRSRRRRNTHIPKPAERKLAALVRQYGTANVIGETHEIAGKRRRNPALTHVAVVGSNMVEASHGAVNILYSYHTPVAIYDPFIPRAWVTTKKWSRTTSHHISKWLTSKGGPPSYKASQEAIEEAAMGGRQPPTSNPPRRVKRRNPLYAELTAGRQGGGFGIGYRRKPKENPRYSSIPGDPGYPLTQASKYVRQIRNKVKRAYAEQLLGYYAVTGKVPAGMTRRPIGLSVMAAQAVEMRLREILRSAGGEIKPNPYGPRAKFKHTRVRAPRRFAKGSMRTVILPGGKAVVLGHLKGERRRMKAGRVKQTVQAILTPKRGRRSVRRKNPVLGILGNPPGAPHGTFLGKASYIEYTHATMAGGKKHYYHDFIPAAYVIAKPNGNMELYHPENRLWKVFPVPAKDVRRGAR